MTPNAYSKVENLKTIRLLLLQHANDAERIMRYLPDMSAERTELLRAYTSTQKAIIMVEQQIRTLEATRGPGKTE
jgi:septal ring factor EnvC (AmiA/AmiB activator)